jgi:hypothetical protein
VGISTGSGNDNAKVRRGSTWKDTADLGRNTFGRLARVLDLLRLSLLTVWGPKILRAVYFSYFGKF